MKSVATVRQSAMMSSGIESLQTVADKVEKDKIKEMKQKIQVLQTCLTHLEYQVGADTFKNVEQSLIDNNNEGESSYQPVNKQPVDVEIDFCNDLFRFAGFNCVRATEEELVFILSCGSEYNQKQAYMVEILIKTGKLSVGRWIMPMTVYKEMLESEVPLKSTKDIPLFLRNCRQYITCYVSRVEQYELLQELALQKGNCSVQSTSALTEIIIDFLNVYETEQNVKLNLRVNIFYNAKEVRPHNIMIKSLGFEDLSREALKHLKNSMKPFKTADLNTAFEKVFMKESGPFVWPPPMNETIVRPANEDEDSEEFQENSINSLASSQKRHRASDSDHFDDSNYEGKSAHHSRSRKKRKHTARANKVDEADHSKENAASSSRKRKHARPAGMKKTTTKKSKKNSGKSSRRNRKSEEPSHLKEITKDFNDVLSI